jgi:hypothetical protein
MNKNNAAQFLPLVQALAEGKTIQYKHDIRGWIDQPIPCFDGCEPEWFRIKPEAREFNISFYEGGRVFDCRPVGEHVAKMPLGTVIRVREILD